jgi:hypothetical protein
MNGSTTKRIERTLTIEYSPITYGKDLLNFGENGYFSGTNHFSFARPVRFGWPLVKVNANPTKRIVRGEPVELLKNNLIPKTNPPALLPAPAPVPSLSSRGTLTPKCAEAISAGQKTATHLSGARYDARADNVPLIAS